MSASIATKIVSRLKRLLQYLVNAKDFIIRCYKALKGSVLWILHLPKAVATAISRWKSSTGRAISDVGQTIKATIQAILRVIAIGATTVLSLILLYIAVLALVNAYQIYQRKKELQRQLEQDAQRQKKEAERRARMVADAQRRQAKLEESRRRREELERQKEAFEARRRADNDQQVYRQWLCQCDALLSCREDMTRFPEPPFWPCSSGCQPNGVLKACPHSIKRLFQASGVDLHGLLEKERLKWHPDKFERCPDSSREQLKAKAEEMFKIVQALLDDV